MADFTGPWSDIQKPNAGTRAKLNGIMKGGLPYFEWETQKAHDVMAKNGYDIEATKRVIKKARSNAANRDVNNQKALLRAQQKARVGEHKFGETPQVAKDWSAENDEAERDFLKNRLANAWIYEREGFTPKIQRTYNPNVTGWNPINVVVAPYGLVYILQEESGAYQYLGRLKYAVNQGKISIDTIDTKTRDELTTRDFVKDSGKQYLNDILNVEIVSAGKTTSTVDWNSMFEGLIGENNTGITEDSFNDFDELEEQTGEMFILEVTEKQLSSRAPPIEIHMEDSVKIVYLSIQFGTLSSESGSIGKLKKEAVAPYTTNDIDFDLPLGILHLNEAESSDKISDPSIHQKWRDTYVQQVEYVAERNGRYIDGVFYPNDELLPSKRSKQLITPQRGRGKKGIQWKTPEIEQAHFERSVHGGGRTQAGILKAKRKEFLDVIEYYGDPIVDPANPFEDDDVKHSFLDHTPIANNNSLQDSLTDWYGEENVQELMTALEPYYKNTYLPRFEKDMAQYELEAKKREIIEGREEALERGRQKREEDFIYNERLDNSQYKPYIPQQARDIGRSLWKTSIEQRVKEMDREIEKEAGRSDPDNWFGGIYIG